MDFEPPISVPPKIAQRKTLFRLLFPEMLMPLGVIALITTLFYENPIPWLLITYVIFIGLPVTYLLASIYTQAGTSTLMFLLKDLVFAYFSKEKSYSFENNGELVEVDYEIEEWFS